MSLELISCGGYLVWMEWRSGVAAPVLLLLGDIMLWRPGDLKVEPLKILELVDLASEPGIEKFVVLYYFLVRILFIP